MQYVSPALAKARQVENSTTPSRRRVVVTGAGIVTSLGHGREVNARGFRQGTAALRPVTLFDTTGQRVHTAGEVALGDLPEGLKLSAREASRLDRSSRLLLAAAAEAWAQSGWQANGEPVATSMGTSAGGMAMGEAFFKQYRADGEAPRKARQPTRVVQYQCQRPAIAMAQALGFSGPTTIIANACASGSNAIGHGYELVAQGNVDRAVVGGFDALCQLVFAGFDSLQALSTTLPRPFDANRDGLALGEGAAVLTLETLEAAQARGAQILGEIHGYGAYTDVHHLTQPHPLGAAASASMAAALEQAGWAPDDVDYINAHGTGTPLNDAAEGAAFQQLRQGGAERFMVSSTKGSIGHLLGAAGAVEAVICLMALDGQWAPPTVNNQMPDAVCTFDLVTAPRDASIRRVLSNSFGFGGANATLAMGLPG